MWYFAWMHNASKSTGRRMATPSHVVFRLGRAVHHAGQSAFADVLLAMALF
jgi:hypothetical protein